MGTGSEHCHFDVAALKFLYTISTTQMRYSVMRLLIVYYGECLWSSLELQHNRVQFPSPRLEGGLCPQVPSSLGTRHRDQDLREGRGVHQTLKSQNWNYWVVVTSNWIVVTHPYALASSYPNVFNSNVSAGLYQSSSGIQKLLSSNQQFLSRVHWICSKEHIIQILLCPSLLN